MKDTAAHGVVAAIIAGGQGRRLGGVAKGLVVVQGQRIVDRQLAVLRPLFARVLVIANDPTAYAGLGVPVLPDQRGGGLGPIAGIETAVSALLPHESAVVCVAADMPFLSARVLGALRDDGSAALAIAPMFNGHFEPLCARYARRALSAIHAQIDQGRYKLMDLLAVLGAEPLSLEVLAPGDVDGRFATNINTAEDLASAASADPPVKG